MHFYHNSFRNSTFINAQRIIEYCELRKEEESYLAYIESLDVTLMSKYVYLNFFWASLCILLYTFQIWLCHWLTESKSGKIQWNCLIHHFSYEIQAHVTHIIFQYSESSNGYKFFITMSSILKFLTWFHGWNMCFRFVVWLIKYHRYSRLSCCDLVIEFHGFSVRILAWYAWE